jgi:hypothetical protein
MAQSAHTESCNAVDMASAPGDIEDQNGYAPKHYIHFQKHFTETESMLELKYIAFLKKIGSVRENYF